MRQVPKRDALPNRRSHDVLAFQFGKLNYTAGLGYHDSRLAEVFLDCNKASSDAADLARDVAVLLSIALQHGIPLETIAGAATRLSDGAPAGLLAKVMDVVREATVSRETANTM